MRVCIPYLAPVCSADGDGHQLALADEVSDRRGRHHHFGGGYAAGSVVRLAQRLTHDALDAAGQLSADLGLLVGGEDVDDAVDGGSCGAGVQGAEDEVAGLRRGERNGDGFQVAHLTNEDDVRVLTQCVLESTLEGQRVLADLALVNHAVAVRVNEFDRVLNREDVAVPRAVGLIDDRREGRGLTGAGRTGHKHQAAGQIGEVTENLGHPQSRQRGGCPTGSSAGQLRRSLAAA